MCQNRKLILAVDMNGCPNRCKHCWLGHMPNKKMDAHMDEYIVDYFKPYFKDITFYSWLREPDFCDNYEERWNRDNRISIGTKPERFELASFWRLVRDDAYVEFLKKVGVKRVQLTFFGMKENTDWYVGRAGAFEELLKATDILVKNQIAPRWQIFISEKNKDEIVRLIELAGKKQLEEKCRDFGECFRLFIHEGSADGENRKLYDIRICKSHITEEMIPFYMDYEEIYSEAELCDRFAGDMSYMKFEKGDSITLNISNEGDVYFNFTHMTEEWKIGNLFQDNQSEMLDKILNNNTYADKAAKTVKIGELVDRYGDKSSDRVFREEDFKMYLFNYFLSEAAASRNFSR